MAEYIKRIRTENGDMQIDYNSLANLPEKPTLQSLGAAAANHIHVPSVIGAADRDHTHTLESLGAAAKDHTHQAVEIPDFPTSLPADGGDADTVDGKHASDFALAEDVEDLKTQVGNMSMESLGITATAIELNYVDGVTSNIQTQLDGKAASDHNHAAADINSGTFNIARIPTITAAKGGHGATDGATGLKNLFAAGNTILSSYQYGTSLPTAGNAGRIFFKKVSS